MFSYYGSKSKIVDLYQPPKFDKIIEPFAGSARYSLKYSKVNNKHLDYPSLAEWCESRKGQTIVCENTKADWLPFIPLKEMHGQKYKTTEAVWYNS